MIRTKVIVSVIAAVGLLALIGPGCDELITEVNEITIAGHPEADFSIGGTGEDSGCVPFTVIFMDQSLGPITGWTWYFGDGDSSNDTNPVHIYDSAGVYNVMLRVVHEPTEGEDTELKKRYVVAGTTFSDFSSDTNQACVGSEITFWPLQLGGVTSWSWDFGDGTVNNSNDTNPTHIYDSIGTFSVELKVHGSCGDDSLTKTDMINITACPTVVIHADPPLSGCNPLTVQFYDSSTYDTSLIALTDWEWDFGDNTKSFEQNPLHEYDANGIFTVKLTVGSTGGTSTDSIVDMILVGDSAVADFAAVNTLGCKTAFQDFTVAFQDSSTGDIISWFWDFCDGGSSTEQNPLHVFASAGTYSVSLDVESSCGTATELKTGYITLSEQLHDSVINYLIFADTITRTPIDTVYLDSVGDSLYAAVYFVDATPGVLEWDWDYGPSVAHGKTDSVIYHYTVEGTWEVVLKLSNGCGEIIIYDTVVVRPAL